MVDLRFCEVEFENTICHIWNLHPRICLVTKFSAKTKIMKKNFVKKTKLPNFGTKNVFFGYFEIEFENNIFIFEINTPNLSNSKILWKKAYIWDQKCLICVFLGWNLRILLSCLKSASSNLCSCKVWCKNKNL